MDCLGNVAACGPVNPDCFSEKNSFTIDSQFALLPAPNWNAPWRNKNTMLDNRGQPFHFVDSELESFDRTLWPAEWGDRIIKATAV